MGGCRLRPNHASHTSERDTSKLAGPLAALALPARAGSEHGNDGHWMYWSLMAGTMQSPDDGTENYVGSDFNGALGWSAILAGFVYAEANVSMGNGDGGFYFLDFFNFDAGFGLTIPFDEDDVRDFLFVGASPLALFRVAANPQVGNSTHAKLQIDDVLLEAKAIPVNYVEDSEAAMPFYLGAHYWVGDGWSVGVRYDSYTDDTSNTSLAFHFVL